MFSVQYKHPGDCVWRPAALAMSLPTATGTANSLCGGSNAPAEVKVGASETGRIADRRV